ncbi:MULTISPECIES: DUF308 domain-containing protein [unclassified Variovorax]|jgi:uncharacterized membrane protein HdeD (DUF308 family)|uniref:DUF308 domain-containing protein n=1 Tax=unclassified Variovorax TaxID=663243 RepID=UPI000F7EAAE5|nr:MULTISPECIES: DUF308 domain-containing protein [unclassified Variovorax]RSZ47588.1 DUF308 domain-containing protein [Variovorax sp. 553]RSZ48287.1 DUF308 domain-containing protein [Variovorax sp. 679]
MSDTLKTESQRAAWLRNYYLVRAAFSFAWVAASFTIAKHSPVLAAALLIVYPAWDALANLLDVRMTGGAKANATQLINIWISALVTLAVAGAFVFELQIVLAIFGVWAIVAGLLQLATAVRRRKDNGGQWVMMLSGAQSALAGGFFVAQQGGSAPVLQTIGGYAAVGAVYFFISGLIVLFRESRRGARGLASGKS